MDAVALLSFAKDCKFLARVYPRPIVENSDQPILLLYSISSSTASATARAVEDRMSPSEKPARVRPRPSSLITFLNEEFSSATETCCHCPSGVLSGRTVPFGPCLTFGKMYGERSTPLRGTPMLTPNYLLIATRSVNAASGQHSSCAGTAMLCCDEATFRSTRLKFKTF